MADKIDISESESSILVKSIVAVDLECGVVLLAATSAVCCTTARRNREWFHSGKASTSMISPGFIRDDLDIFCVYAGTWIQSSSEKFDLFTVCEIFRLKQVGVNHDN